VRVLDANMRNFQTGSMIIRLKLLLFTIFSEPKPAYWEFYCLILPLHIYSDINHCSLNVFFNFGNTSFKYM